MSDDQNIILIGFKGSGKTTLGQRLAKQLKREFLDTDHLLEACYESKTGEKKTFREIYSILGEAGFRALESEVLLSLQNTKGAVISTGGGVAAHKQNVPLLRQSGHIVFIDPALELLKRRLSNVDTPLFKGTSLTDLYQARRPLYLEAAQTVFSHSLQQSPSALVKKLIKHLQDERVLSAEGQIVLPCNAATV